MTRKKKTPTNEPTQEWVGKFLALLAKSGNVTVASRGAGVSRNLVYQFRKENEQFAQDWDNALEEAIETLEAVAWDRARKQSDTLLIFLLKAHKPMYRDSSRLDVTSDGKPLQGVVLIPATDMSTLQNDDGSD